jgi:hypothetical protein
MEDDPHRRKTNSYKSHINRHHSHYRNPKIRSARDHHRPHGSSGSSYWKLVEDIYLSITDKAPIDWVLPEKPISTPWLAVILLGIHLEVEAAQWLGDFERCMAWLLLEDVFAADS